MVASLGEDVRFRNYPKGLISKLVVTLDLQRLVRQGHLLYLCHIHKEGKNKVDPNDIAVMREFVDVYPKETPCMPPLREIKFTIDLVPRT